MIITGYQGIGKTTLAKKDKNIIDLESSSFWWTYDEESNKKYRPENWYVYYCQVAMDLSKQGYIVFVSSHTQVKEFLDLHAVEDTYAIFPALWLKEDWIKKLENRYKETGSEKDEKALEHAKTFYDRDISCFMGEAHPLGWFHDFYIIENMDYDLAEVVEKLKESHSK